MKEISVKEISGIRIVQMENMKTATGCIVFASENGDKLKSPTMSPLNNLKSGVFTLEFKRELPQNAGKRKEDTMSKEMRR